MWFKIFLSHLHIKATYVSTIFNIWFVFLSILFWFIILLIIFNPYWSLWFIFLHQKKSLFFYYKLLNQIVFCILQTCVLPDPTIMRKARVRKLVRINRGSTPLTDIYTPDLTSSIYIPEIRVLKRVKNTWRCNII